MSKWEFFGGCRTLDEGKHLYRKLAKVNHPDIGGDEATMKRINAEYDRFVQFVAQGGQPTGNAATEDRRRYSESDQRRAATENVQAFIEIVRRLLKIPGIEIELCGSWLWISGKTYAAKNELHAAGCQYSGQKKMWYWHQPDDGCPYNRRAYTMDHIRRTYGSQAIRAEDIKENMVHA